MAIMDRSMEGKRQYTTGISKGVFFGEDGKAFPWNGLISVTEKPQANAPTPVYNSLGEKYDQFGNIAEKKHSLTCYTYPEEMDEFLGIEYLEEMGYSVDERPPKKFSMAYRTELGDGLYEIHVLLNQIATFADTAKNTITNNITPTVVTMNLEGVPDPRIKTSHIILDSRLPLTASAERLLFGNNMVDGNINEFLDAEPTWVTVATNYAPIIEPDYDNYVWLGGENLINRNIFTSNEYFDITDTGRRTEYNNKIYRIERIHSGSPPLAMGRVQKLPVGSYVTTTVDYEKIDNSTIYTNMYQNDGLSLRLMEVNTHSLGNNIYRIISTFGPISEAQSDSGFWPYMYQQGVVGDVTYLRDYKLEVGTIASSWTPPKSFGEGQDPYVLPAITPENYKPGVKGGIIGVYAIAFYDEINKGLGIYPTNSDVFASRLIPRTLPEQELLGSPLRIKTDIVIDEIITGPLRGFARLVASQGNGSPSTPSAPNVRGTHTLEASTDSLPMMESGYEYLFFYHGGTLESGTITFKNTLVTPSSDVDFFDINSIPPTKGDRYVRVPGRNADYTEHQQLILQSKSRVILSDITPHQYTLEASDSQLRVDGQTFTFKGPQATPVGDDQFTIDDEIYGEE